MNSTFIEDIKILLYKSNMHKMNLFRYFTGSLELGKAYYAIRRIRDKVRYTDSSNLTNFDRFEYYHSRLFIKEFRLRFEKNSLKKRRLLRQWNNSLDEGNNLAYLCYTHH
jgi:hypothetical protein